jgi:hypothetical protein
VWGRDIAIHGLSPNKKEKDRPTPVETTGASED